MFERELLRRLKLGDLAAYDEVQQRSVRNPDSFIHCCHAYVLAGTYWNEFETTVFLLRLLSSVIGYAGVKAWICSEWELMSDTARRTIAYCFSDPDLVLPTDFAVELFWAASSTVEDRHLIVAGLASTAGQRNCGPLALELADHIGRYDDVNWQASLEQFIVGVKQSFGVQSEENK